ncbi:MAG: GDP-mannose dehydrogenase, partial [Pseudonocardiaceae bacterium]|nr:GDP-mannose dehydrogenase [Pseudonocardiaceae bacterium]
MGVVMKVAVLGVGYVGSVTAACLAAGGYDVWGVDVDGAKVDAISSGRSPVVEPGLDDLVARAVTEGRLHATTSCVEALDGADLSLVCVGTPSTSTGSADLRHVRSAVEDIAAALQVVRAPESGLHSVVVRSTVPPGTVESVVLPALTALQEPGVQTGAAMCPEFLREGSGIADFFAPP